MKHTVILQCSELLIKHKLTIVFAESATGGRLASEFSMIKDAGKFLRGALVCYDASLKEEILAVPKELVEKYSPESTEVTMAITIGLQNLICADIHIGVTGLPAPGGSENTEKPVGTMFIYGTHNRQEIFNEKIIFEGDQEEVIIKTVNHIAQLIINYLNN